LDISQASDTCCDKNGVRSELVRALCNNRIASIQHYWSDVVAAAACAALFSGVPSTLYALITGGDVLEATRAAGSMLISPSSSDGRLFMAAAMVHLSISFFWAAILTWLLPRTRTMLWAMAALTVIAVLDLRVIGQIFPEIYALPFWPQFADHLAFGAVLGATLQWRRGRRRTAEREI
jgi:hypothetical protein